MNRLVLLVSLFGVLACGQLSKNNDSAAEGSGSNGPTTLALDSKKDLPDCSSDNQDQLVYIIKEQQFYTCDDKWTKIDIQGEDGADAEQLGEDNYLDKITGYVWQIGNATDWTTASTACTGDFTGADRATIRTAVLHGLSLPAGVWTSEEYSSASGYNLDPNSMSTDYHDLKSVQHLLVCVKK